MSSERNTYVTIFCDWPGCDDSVQGDIDEDEWYLRERICDESSGDWEYNVDIDAYYCSSHSDVVRARLGQQSLDRERKVAEAKARRDAEREEAKRASWAAARSEVLAIRRAL